MKMQAAITDEYGGPAVLRVEETDKPVPKANEVLVRVYNASVNRTDTGILSGRYFIMRLLTGLFKPKHKTPGTDFAGRVEKVGSKVTNFKAGDDVFGFNDEGLQSHAQYLTIKASKGIMKLPAKMDYRQAAGSIEGAHYAYNMITKSGVKKGERALVNGATGAIGSAMVQLLTHFGAEVVGVCRGQHDELIKSLGAVQTFDYENEDFRRTKLRFDLVIDTVVGSEYSTCRHLLKDKGRYISSELGTNGAHIWRALLGLFLSGKKVIFPIPIDCKRSMQLLSDLYAEDQYTAVVDKVYPLSEVVDAYTYVVSGQKVGSVVLSMD